MKMRIMLVSGMGAILLGLAYIFRIFGPVEAEVVTWGWISLFLGAGLILLTIGIGHSNQGIANVLLSLGYSGLALLQVFPILLWFAFHGAGISDETPASPFMAHWSYSIPHIALLLLCLFVTYQLWRLPGHSHPSR